MTDLDLPFRLDLCDDYGFITHEDQTAPAFGFERDSPYYATSCAYFEGFRSNLAREIDLASVAVDGDALAASDTVDLLPALGLGFDELDQEAVRADIARAVRAASIA